MRNSATLTFRDGSGADRKCLSPVNGVAASAFNTTEIRVKSAVPAAFQDIMIDESNNGRFVTASGKRMFFTILSGTGNDHLTARMGTGLDQVRVRTATTGLAFGPQIDLDTNGVVDVGMTAAGLVTIDGGGGSDLLNGTGSNTFQLELLGGCPATTRSAAAAPSTFSAGATAPTRSSPRETASRTTCSVAPRRTAP